MAGRPSLGRDRDRDHDRPGSQPGLSSSPPQSSSLPRPLQLEHRAGSGPQIPSHMPLPPLPESPLVTTFHSNARPPTSTSDPATPMAQPTIRPVTPEHLDHRKAVAQGFSDAGEIRYGSTGHAGRGFGSMSPQSSPRAIPGAGSLSHHGSTSSRRQGIVFSDAIAGSFDSSSSSPPPRPTVFRSRTHTIDGGPPIREALGPAPTSEPRTRAGSFSSSGTADSSLRATPSHQGPPIESFGYPLVAPQRSSDTHIPPAPAPPGGLTASSSAVSISSLEGTGFASPTTSTASREKRGSNRRLIKRTTSRPTSPLISPPPSVDSLPSPIPTDNANKVLMLMKTLSGRMRGEIEYQNKPEEQWNRGIGYIDEEKGSLMFDAGEQGPFFTALVPDLRGCRVLPVERPDKDGQCLELVSAYGTVEFVFRPLIAAEFDLWLAALLCWQQLRQVPGAGVTSNPKTTTARSTTTSTSDLSKRRPSAVKVKEGTIIKVGKVMFWDKGVATSPGAIVKRPSTRDLKSMQSSWRRVSCILQGNGEFKLVTENDVTTLSIIELTQLARSAIQQLDKSVLDEDYCIAIFPIYAASSTHLSIFRPVYIALDSRVAFEVWFVLLRAFAIPDIYELDAVLSAQDDSKATKTNFDEETGDSTQKSLELQFSENEDHPRGQPLQTQGRQEKQLFRLKKSLNLRVTEAKIKPRGPDESQDSHKRSSDRSHDHRPNDKPGKIDYHDHLVGNYLAEVILDGEVRARTTTKTDTKNPFWREDYQFGDLPPTLPLLSVVLKRVEGNLDSFTHQLQASLGLPKTGNLREVMCGSVDIPLSHLEKGKDHEQWLPIYDDRQQPMGSMLIKVHHEELAVLSAKEYVAMSNMLHKFSSGLTLQIAEVMPGSLRRLAELFLNIFQVSATASDWLMALVEDEIDGIGNQASMKKFRFSRRLRSDESVESTTDRELIVRDMGRSLQGEANLLFRGNSLLTQALEFHMRRLGKEYLEEVLSDKIFEINEINPDCEVDPSKVQTGDDLAKHWEHLMQYTNEVWECIASSAAQFPPELRQILKYIRAVAEDRYGDFLRTVTYTSVSGFLFLRFVCPAILNPKLFGLLRDHPRPRAQRTLTLIAKGLQALANLSTIGKKETWMEPMNRFLALQKQSVKDFIDAICSVSAERANAFSLIPASYSTPIMIMGRLPSSSREGFPSLPYLIDHARNFAALVKLWADVHPLSAPGHVYEGELLEFNNACMELQAKSDTCFTEINIIRHAVEADDMAVDGALADSIERSSLADTVNMSYNNTSSWMDNTDASSTTSYGAGGASSSRVLVPPGSSGSEMDEHKGRQFNFGNRNNSQQYESRGSIKILQNGKQARKFFSGIISRKPRTASPDHAAGPGPAPGSRGQDKDQNKSRGRGQNDERGNDAAKDREHVREQVPDRNSVRSRDGGKDVDRDGEHKKASGKDKDKEKSDKKDKHVKVEKPGNGRNVNIGESWSPSGFTSTDVLMRHNYNS